MSNLLFFPSERLSKVTLYAKTLMCWGFCFVFFENKDEGSRQLVGYVDLLPRISHHGLVILRVREVVGRLINLANYRQM